MDNNKCDKYGKQTIDRSIGNGHSFIFKQIQWSDYWRKRQAEMNMGEM